ncbi:MAG: hypothetical protein IPO09_08920 [Anaeromyxobacter sp.]|nr:hypothetical protein [Anaeromyxobacter sp.]MBL0277635.1 hypothetical protein [Anaeromyxobacter sp.]
MPSSTWRLAPLLLVLLAAAPSAARASPSARWLALEPGLALPDGGARPGLALAAGWWLEGEVDVVTRLAFEAAPRTTGRPAAAEVTPACGLRWAPDLGAWRPALGLVGGVRLGAAAGARATGLLELGLERALAADLTAGLALGLGWTEGAGVAPRAALALRLGF